MYMENEIDIFTMDELCEYLGISKNTLYMLTSKNRIPHFKVGRQIRFRKAVIDKWAEEQEKCKKK